MNETAFSYDGNELKNTQQLMAYKYVPGFGMIEQGPDEAKAQARTLNAAIIAQANAAMIRKQQELYNPAPNCEAEINKRMFGQR